jgi:hypothetical protein
MRVSVVIDDNFVAIDGRGFVVDCSMLDRELHAIQWYDDFGEIEFRSRWIKEEKRWDRRPNLHFDNFDEYAGLVHAWITEREADDRAKAERKRADEEFEQIRAETEARMIEAQQQFELLQSQVPPPQLEPPVK